MTDGKIIQKRGICHGYEMIEMSNRDVLVIDPYGKLIARAPSFKEATRIITADRRMNNGTNDIETGNAG